MTSKLEAARIKTLPEDAFYIPNFINEDEERYLLDKITSTPLPRWTNLSHRRLQSWPSQLITKSSASNNNNAQAALIDAPLPSWLVSPIISPRLVDDLRIFADSGSPHKAPNHVLVNEYRAGQGIMPHEDGAAYYPVVATVSLGGVVVLDVYGKRGKEHDEDGGEEETDYSESEGEVENATNNEGNGVGGDKDGDGRFGDMMATTQEKYRPEPQFRILQERRSLLVTQGRMYTDFLHGIADTDRDESLCKETICNWDLLGETDSYASGWSQRETRISLTYRDVLKVVKLGNAMKFLGPR